MPRIGDAKLKGGVTSVQPNRKKGRPQNNVSLFDAVAGRVTSEGFLPVNPATSRYRDTISRSTQPISPEEALFRLKGRAFQEDFDPYWAHERLTEDQQLPDSDLLKAVHAYASDFYNKTFGEAAQVDYHSLDETALLCLGMLLEEMVDEVLGDTGDLALTEGEAVESLAVRGGMRSRKTNSEVPVTETGSTSAHPGAMTEEDDPTSNIRSSKRRKTKHDAK